MTKHVPNLFCVVIYGICIVLAVALGSTSTRTQHTADFSTTFVPKGFRLTTLVSWEGGSTCGLRVQHVCQKKKKKRSSFSQLSLVIFLNLDATKKKHYVQKSCRLIAFLCVHARWKKMSIWRYKLWLPWKRCVILAWFSHTWVAQTCESVRQTTQIASALTKWAPLSIF